MTVWRTPLFLVCLVYSFTEVQGVASLKMQTLPNGTKAMAVHAKIEFKGKLVFSCQKGYAQHPQNSSLCVAVCESGCPNGYCNTPGVCNCLPRHVELFGECHPTCALGSCANGECVGDICTKCKKGFKMTPTGHYCAPDCKGRCDRSTETCTGPNKCTCKEGYKKRNNRCMPICERNCLEGTCISPGKCQCHPGAIYKDGVCQARCWMDCTNGICIRENVCECKKGFSLALPSLKCIDSCVGCENGNCVGPNQCECNEGYTWSKSKQRCTPNCHDCEGWNTECVAPNVCKCQKGFHQTQRLPTLKCSKSSKCGTRRCKRLRFLG